MFENCTSLTSLDLTGFDISSVSNMNNMFKNCSSLRNHSKVLDMDNWSRFDIFNIFESYTSDINFANTGKDGCLTEK